jgi:subtilisin family serine protease
MVSVAAVGVAGASAQFSDDGELTVEQENVTSSQTADFQLGDDLGVDLLEGQSVFAEFGGEASVSVEVANLEALTVTPSDATTVPEADLTLLLNGNEVPLGETIEFNGTVNGVNTLTVQVADSGNLSEGDLVGLEHTFEGVNESVTAETGPTELTETLDPPEYEVSNLSAPDNVVAGDAIPVSFEITNVGQQTPDSYGYQFFATDGVTPISLPATQLNLAPTETQTVSLAVAGVESFYGPGDVFTHGARVGVWNEGGFISPPSIDPVEDNVTAEAALQAPGSQFNIASLDAPLEAGTGENIDVTATIESVGELGDNQSVEFRFEGTTVASQTVDLDAFTLGGGLDSTTVTFQDVTLPSEADAYEHGVFTDDDSATASIGVGVELTDATLVRSGSGTGATDTLSLFEDDLPVNFGPVDVVNAENVTKSVIAEADTLVLHDLGDSQAEVIPAVENDPTTGAVYLEQWTASNAIADRVDVVGDPDSSTTAFNNAPPAIFEIKADHPIFDGIGGPGDNVTIHTEGFSDIAWFNGADGATLANVSDQTGAGGPAAAVDPDSGSVLLSTIAVTPSTPGLGDFTPEAGQILANSVDFATPEPLEAPYFEVTNLAAPAEGGTGELIDVNATVTNDANVSGQQTVEFVFDGAVAANTTISLNAGESTTVEFNDIELPQQTGTFEHGIQTANDSQTAEIAVGEVTQVSVVEFGTANGDDVLSLLEDSLPGTFVAQVVNANNVTDTVVDETDIFVFNDLSGQSSTAERRPRVDDIVRTSEAAVSSGVDIDTAELIANVEAQATTGAVYLDQWGGDSDAIANRSSAIGDPASTSDDFSFGDGPVEYTIEQNHPLFDGVGSQGDVVTIHTVGSGDVSYFSGASGETLATVQNQAGQGGNAVAVDPDSGSVLLSSLGATGFVGAAEYTDNASQILANGVEVAAPPEFSGPFFDVTGLTAPAQADTGATINVSATVTNVGDATGTQTVEFVFNGSVAATVSGVELDPGNETTVEFTDVPLPAEGGVYEHGVQTANDSQTAQITVGSADIELVNLTQPSELTLNESIATEMTITNNGTAPYEGEVFHVTNLNDTAPDSGAIGITANVTAVTLDPGENATFSDNLGTFSEINGALGTDFGPGDNVETGYWVGQNLNFQESPEPTIENIFSEEITIVNSSGTSSSVADDQQFTAPTGGLETVESELSLANQQDIREDRSERSDEAVLLLGVERNIDRVAYQTDQVDAEMLQADSEATLGPVADAIEAMPGAEVQNQFWVGNILSVTADMSVHDIETFERLDGVIGVSRNVELANPAPVGDNPAVDIDQNGNVTYGLEQIDVPGFEDKYNTSGEGATVTIIDDGISNPEEGHPDLEFAIKAVAEGGEVTTGTLGTAGSHGEHTAGTATGAADPAGDVPRYGVAPNADLIMVNTFEGQAAAVDTLAAVQFAAQQDSDVASMSLGFPVQTPGNSVLELLMEQQMQDANAMGTAVVGSAGNEGSGAAGGPVTSPGAEFTGFSIGASNAQRGIAGFSSGTIVDRFSVDYVDVGGGTEFPAYYPRQYVKPDVSAPGVQVLSSGPLGGDIGDPAATYSYSSGTSMAAPHVAGAIALIQSATEAELDPKLIETALAETAEKPENNFPSLNGRDIRYGTGIINVTAATEAIMDGSLLVEGTVTDSEGQPVVGATVESADGALTSTDENGSYTLFTTSTPVNVTADGFAYESQTQTVSAEPPEVSMTNLSIAGQGDDVTVLAGEHNVSAEMSHTGGGTGEVQMNLSIGETTLTQTVSIDSGETLEVTFENATSGLEPGVYNVSMSAVNASVTGTLALSIDAGSGEPASDTTGDKLFNDVNGDGDYDIVDVQALFDALGDQDVQANADLFNFAGVEDDRVSIFDVQALFSQLPNQS